MSVYCQFYDNKQNKISEQIVSNASFSIPANAVSGLFYDNTFKIDGLKLTFNNLIANDFSFDFAKDYFLYVFPVGYTEILATSIRSSSYLTYVPELSQNDKDYLKNLSDNSAIDFSSIVTALNSITSALSALTNLNNLSNLADLANIITAITNKDNQSDIVDKLSNIFEYQVGKVDPSAIGSKLSCFKFVGGSNGVSYTNVNYSNISMLLNKLVQVFCKQIASLSFSYSDPLFQNTYLKDISKNVLDIETKLEQNLPFTTIVNNDYIDNCVSASVAYNKKIENIPFN